MRTHNQTLISIHRCRNAPTIFTFGVLLRQPELGVSIRLAAKGDMEIVMFWPEVVVTVVAAMAVIIMVSIYWG